MSLIMKYFFFCVLCFSRIVKVSPSPENFVNEKFLTKPYMRLDKREINMKGKDDFTSNRTVNKQD